MTDLILVLSRSPQQQAAFDAYVAGQYDQNSPDFHQWLTPDQIGAQFGPSHRRHCHHLRLAQQPWLYHRRK